MTLQDVISELKTFANEQTRKILIKHGAPDNTLGIKVQDMKKVQKKVKKDHKLALALYDTAIPDYMYLAGLIADENKVTSELLNDWLNKSEWQTLSEYTIPWLAADSGMAFEKGMEWLDSKDEKTSSAAWATLSSFLSITPDEKIDKKSIASLLEIIKNNINKAEGRTKYQMNGFIIAAGSFYTPLSDTALNVAEKIGKIEIDMNGTACKVPEASGYIKKLADKGYLGRKKKIARC